jgi:hypothetical protein
MLPAAISLNGEVSMRSLGGDEANADRSVIFRFTAGMLRA